MKRQKRNEFNSKNMNKIFLMKNLRLWDKLQTKSTELSFENGKTNLSTIKSLKNLSPQKQVGLRVGLVLVKLRKKKKQTKSSLNSWKHNTKKNYNWSTYMKKRKLTMISLKLYPKKLISILAIWKTCPMIGSDLTSKFKFLKPISAYFENHPQLNDLTQLWKFFQLACTQKY